MATAKAEGLDEGALAKRRESVLLECKLDEATLTAAAEEVTERALREARLLPEQQSARRNAAFRRAGIGFKQVSKRVAEIRLEIFGAELPGTKK